MSACVIVCVHVCLYACMFLYVCMHSCCNVHICVGVTVANFDNHVVEVWWLNATVVVCGGRNVDC